MSFSYLFFAARLAVLVSALAALSRTFVVVSIFFIVGVPVWAMGLSKVELSGGRCSGGGAEPTSKILNLWHRLKMVWINAATNTAKVINFQAFRYRSFEENPSGTVSTYRAASKLGQESNLPVSIVTKGSEPYPATGLGYHFNLFHKTLHERARLRSFLHWSNMAEMAAV